MKFRPWRRVLVSMASLRRFVRRLSRHMIRIKIVTTLNVRPSLAETPLPAVAPVVAAAPPEPTSGAPCFLCRRSPQSPVGDLLCNVCAIAMPTYIQRSFPTGNMTESQHAELTARVQAWQDAARDN